MDFLNKYSRFMRNTGPARFFIPVGILLVIFGILMSTMFSFDATETVGKVTAVDSYVSDGKTVYDVTFDYSVDGKAYTNTFYELEKEYAVGDEIKVYYDAEKPENVSNSSMTALFGLAAIALGLLSCILGVTRTVKAVNSSRQADAAAGVRASDVDFSGFKTAEGVKEYYVLYDEDVLKPGYRIEDGDRKLLYEGKMEKNSLLKARTFRFTDHTKGVSETHEVGHASTVTYNNEAFSGRSTIKFDGRDVWDVLHERGISFYTDIHSKFPKVIYNAVRDGKAFAVIESSSRFVHEEDEAQHAFTLPAGMFYYRVWSDSDDLDSLFLSVLAISETEQVMVE